MNRILMQHNKINNLDRNRLNQRKIFTLGTFCAERQFPVYEKLAIGKSWGNTELFREVLNKIWDWLLEKNDKPEGYSEICEQAVNTVEESQDDLDALAFDASVSFSGLIYMVENDVYEPNSIEGTIETSLNMIDSFLFDHLLNISSTSQEGNSVINSHELITNELKEQDYCIDMILNPEFSVETIKILRERATNQSIFGNYWFE